MKFLTKHGFTWHGISLDCSLRFVLRAEWRVPCKHQARAWYAQEFRVDAILRRLLRQQRERPTDNVFPADTAVKSLGISWFTRADANSARSPFVRANYTRGTRTGAVRVPASLHRKSTFFLRLSTVSHGNLNEIRSRGSPRAIPHDSIQAEKWNRPPLIERARARACASW